MSAREDARGDLSEQQPYVDPSPLALLEDMRNRGQFWDAIAPRHGVANADPPWKTSLYATCECLAVGGALASLDRRHAEDQLAESTYRDVPAPERQLLALAHTMLRRGLLSEDDLNHRMNAVRARLQAS
jgi:hypothetical protein